MEAAELVYQLEPFNAVTVLLLLDEQLCKGPSAPGKTTVNCNRTDGSTRADERQPCANRHTKHAPRTPAVSAEKWILTTDGDWIPDVFIEKHLSKSLFYPKCWLFLTLAMSPCACPPSIYVY